ncbi:hypothetical protein ACFFUZ_29580, partial [Kibdelosporangium philippinense]
MDLEVLGSGQPADLVEFLALAVDAVKVRRPSRHMIEGMELVLSAWLAEAISITLLLLVLACAVVRPWGWPEALVAVPAAALTIAIGAISLPAAVDETERLASVVGFLAAVLVLAQLCADEGLFQACGAWLARAAAARPKRLLKGVFLLASLITAVLRGHLILVRQECLLWVDRFARFGWIPRS